jgi:hypothetical protein
MHILGMTIGFSAFLLEGLLILRGARSRVFRQLPLFRSYIVYCFCTVLGLYLIYWLDRKEYASAYWLCYLVSILVEFTVLAEISDQIFQPFPAIRNLGRALTVLISVALGLLYILPPILGSAGRDRLLLDFALRASVTKAIILAALFYMARHYDCQVGKNVRGLMLGFSIYVATSVAIWASAEAFGSALFAHLLWFMEPLAFLLCLLVWTVSLWHFAPMPSLNAISAARGGDSESVAVELTRFNSELSKFLHK